MAHPIFRIGGTYTVTHNGSYAPVILVAATLADDGFDITLNNVSATIGSTFEVSDGILDIAGFATGSFLTSFEIGNDGILEIGSSLNLAVASSFTFDNTAGTSADLVFASGIDISTLTTGIVGFKSGSVIDLSGETITGTFYDPGTGVLTVDTATGVETLAFQGTYTNANFTFSGSDILFACFAEGTLIDGPNGPVAVETLAAGDLVHTTSGAVRPVKWVGYRNLDLTRYSDPGVAHPVLILADAFGQGLPRRDLVVSPDHALLINDVLIPARMLVNDMTIRRQSQRRSVTYYHVELETHDVLLAEGLPAETYLDTGNRAIFENNDGAVALRPDFADVEETKRRALGCCRPFAIDEQRVKPAWDRLAQRAEALGYASKAATPATDDPDLVLVADGRRLLPALADGDRFVFVLPAAATAVRMASRSMVPADRSPWIDDRRTLGVKVRQITVSTPRDHRIIPMDHPMLDAGWWDVEATSDSLGRWTNGDAIVGRLPGGALVTVELAGRAPSYPTGAAETARLAA